MPKSGQLHGRCWTEAERRSTKVSINGPIRLREMCCHSRCCRVPRVLRLSSCWLPPIIRRTRRCNSARSPDTAISQFIQLDLSNTIPAELSWPGLDSLYRNVLAHTYGMSVAARRENPITGIDGTAPLRVRTNEHSTFVLTAQSRDGIETIILDSATYTTDATLNLRVARSGALILKDAQYDFVITARQVATGEKVTRTLDGTVAVPSIAYVNVPVVVDSITNRPERSRPQRALNVATAVGMGMATIAMGLELRAAKPIASTSADNRVIAVGVLMTAGVSVAAWFDRGRPLDKNVDANRLAYGSALREAGCSARGKRSARGCLPSVHHAEPGRALMLKRILPPLAIAFGAVGANAQSPDSLYQPAMDLRVGGALESAVRTVAVGSGGSTRSSGSLREAEFLVRAPEGMGVLFRYETGSLPPGVAGEPTAGFRSVDGVVLVGAHVASLALGYQFRWNPLGSETRRLGLARLGAEFGRRAEAIGIAVRASGAYLRAIRPDGPDSLQADGIDAETNVTYAPRGLPVYLDLGYRRETFRLWRPTGTFRREESSKVIVGIGFQYGLSEK